MVIIKGREKNLVKPTWEQPCQSREHYATNTKRMTSFLAENLLLATHNHCELIGFAWMETSDLSGLKTNALRKNPNRRVPPGAVRSTPSLLENVRYLDVETCINRMLSAYRGFASYQWWCGLRVCATSFTTINLSQVEALARSNSVTRRDTEAQLNHD